MWAEFWLAVVAGTAFAFLPSYAILRAFRFPRTAAAAAAPVIALLFYSALAIVYSKLGVWTDGWVLFVPLCAMAVIVCPVSWVLRRRSAKPASTEGPGGAWQDRGMIALYAGVGMLVGSYIFLGPLTTPDCTTYTYDDQSHLGYLRSFLELGDYSSLSVNYEYDLGGAGGYYPAAWHLFAASIVSICAVPQYVGANAALFIMCAIMYPLCCLALVRRIFARSVPTQIIGAFLTLAFASFPWEFIAYGRLVANLLAFCFVPLMLLCTVEVCTPGRRKADRVRFALLLLMSFAFSLFTQPSVCFTWVFFSVPYVMHVIWTAPAKGGGAVPVRKRVLRVALFCLGVFLFLIACYMLPFLYSLTRFKWVAPFTVPQAALNAILQGSPQGPYAYVLAVVVLVGFVVALKKREMRWLALLLVILGVMYVVDAGTNTRWKNYLTGWWYTDSHRVLGMYAIASFFVATLGTGAVAQALFGRIKRQRLSIVCQALFGMVVSGLILFPSFSVGDEEVVTPMGYLRGWIGRSYNVSTPDGGAFYSAPEREFVRKAAEVTGDSIVFNIPKDGSAFAYQDSGMRVFSRWADDGLSEDGDVRLIQRSLDDIATNPSVRRAVEERNIEYVMMLDQGHVPFTAYWGDYSDNNWRGVLSINEDTPGFELVMSDGDMSLYRILPEEEVAHRQQQ